jgi:hypothetical protein
MDKDICIYILYERNIYSFSENLFSVNHVYNIISMAKDDEVYYRFVMGECVKVLAESLSWNMEY